MATPKYDMRINPVYQVDFQATAKGKRVSATKKRVIFKFGFSNAEALGQGLTGTHCRGEEHEVSLVWSLTSGKRLIVADEEEVHYSQGKRGESRFEASWAMYGNHVLKLIAHAAPAVFSKDPRFRQFDLQIDGMSFFDMPKVFELGVVSGEEVARRRHMAVAGPYGGMSYSSPPPSHHNFALPREEAWSSAADQYELRRSVTRGPSMDERSPRSTYQSPVAASSGAASYQGDMLSDPTSVNHVQDHLSVPVALIDQVPPAAAMPPQAPVAPQAPVPPQFQAPPVQTVGVLSSTYPPAVQPPVPVDEFAPRPPPPPTFASKANEILSAYGPVPAAPALPALAYEPHNPEHGGAPVQPGAFHASPSFSDPAALPAEAPAADEPPAPDTPEVIKAPLTMNSPISVLDIDVPKNEFDKAIHNLVNLDDITEKPASPEERRIAMKKEEQMKKEPKSHGLPPTAPAWHLGTQPSLNDIKTHAPQKTPTKEVMRTHAFDPNAAHSGMMVVYGATPPPPPPTHAYGIPAAPGFGAGAAMYYQQQPYAHAAY